MAAATATEPGEAAPLVEPQELPHHKYLQDDAAPLATATAVPIDVAATDDTDAPLSSIDDVPDLDDHEEGYQMLREEGEAAADSVERRSRRAAKHHKLPDDEE